MKVADALDNFALLQFQQTLEAEFLDGETAEDGAVDHRASKRVAIYSASACEIAHETAGESVARAGGIVDFIERKCRNAKDPIVVDEHGAVFAALDDERFGAKLENLFRGAEEIVFVRELTSFRIVDHQKSVWRNVSRNSAGVPSIQ